MTDERSPPSALKGRLADVYVPALLSSTLDALSRRLGNRATIDDPLYGRASTLAAIEPLLARTAAYFAGANATYEHVCSTTGVDRDASEGRLAMTFDGATRAVPIAIVAERRRLREIELRVYYAPPGLSGDRSRAPLTSPASPVGLSSLMEGILDGFRRGAVEQALAGFEGESCIVDATGRSHGRQEGAMRTFLGDLGESNVAISGVADDGRTACIEGVIVRAGREPAAALLAFQRGTSGLVNELRLYGG